MFYGSILSKTAAVSETSYQILWLRLYAVSFLFIGKDYFIRYP